jgi:hypothetical protein
MHYANNPAHADLDVASKLVSGLLVHLMTPTVTGGRVLA